MSFSFPKKVIVGLTLLTSQLIFRT